MKKRWRRLIPAGIVLAAAAALILQALLGTGEGGQMENVPAASLTYSGTGAALNARFGEDAAFTLADPRTQTVLWTSGVEEERRNALSSNKLWRDYMASLITINYTDSRKTKFEVKRLYAASASTKVSSQPLEGGIRYTLRFSEIDIALSVELRMEGSMLTLRIPAASIEEGDRYRLMSVEILPFFGAADHTTEGYIFYPDGCGALMDYANYRSRPGSLQTYALEIYGSSRLEEGDQIAGNAMLPLYGVKNGDQALLAAVTAGAADTLINIAAEGTVVALNRVAFQMNYRYTYTVPGSDIVTTKSDTSTTYADKALLRQDFEACYFFLSGEEADYSGMANTYRAFLRENGLIRQSVEKEEAYPLSVAFMTGAQEEQMLLSKNVAASPFASVESMTDSLAEKGVSRLDVTLLGWEKGGYGRNVRGYQPWSLLGGASGLGRLAAALTGNHHTLILAKNVLSVSAEDTGYTLQKDAVFEGSGLVKSDDSRENFLLNAAASERWTEAFAQKNKTQACVLLQDYGSFVTANYSKNQVYSRSQEVQRRQEALRKLAGDDQAESRVEAEGGNAYILPYVRRLSGIPSVSSRLPVMDREVPFYQMVVHGAVEYTGDAYNLFYDAPTQFLQLLEYGYQPHFELTETEPDALKYTACHYLFSCRFEDWQETMLDVCARLQEFVPVRDSAMVKHTAEGNGRIVTYENGYRLYINYGTERADIQGVSVEAGSYRLIKSGEGAAS